MPLFAHGRWLSRIARFFAAVLVLVAVLATAGCFWGGPYIAGVVRVKLQTMVAQQLNARLEIGRIRYRWPYGAEVQEAALYSTTPGEPSIKLVGFDRLDLQLGRFPLREGPLLIERIDINSPTLYLVETKENGFVGLEHLLRNQAEKAKDAQTPPKLSDILRLRHVQLSNARIEFDDRTISRSVPFVWDKLGLNLDSTPLSASAYHFKAGAGNGDTARVDVNGRLDLDTLVLDLDSLSLTARVAPGQRNSPLPAGVQRVLNTLGVAGTGRASITGVVPLMESRNLELRGDFVIDDAQGRLSSEGRPLNDLDITGRIGIKGRDVTVGVNVFSCRRGAMGVSIQPTVVNYNLQTNRWTTTPIRAAIAYIPPAIATGIRQQRATVLLTAELTELVERDHFRVNMDGTKVSLPDTAGDLRVDGRVRYDDDGITIETARIDGLGGPVTLAGVINEDVAAVVGEIAFEGADLDKLNRLIDPGTTRTMSGRLDGHLKAAVTDTLDAVRGEGRFRVTGGTFARVPILGGVADALKLPPTAFTAHEATGRFTLDPGRVKFSRFAISTDVLSIRGQGDVWFDGALGLSLYADGRWKNDRERKQELYIPVLSDIGRGLAATGAYIFGSVSRQFTHFMVTGTIDRPKLTPSPAPVLTESLERAFREE